MVLFVREGCPFCDDLGVYDIKDLLVVVAIDTPQGPRLKMDSLLLDVPGEVSGFPFLLIDEKAYVGAAPVKEQLQLLAKKSNRCAVLNFS